MATEETIKDLIAKARVAAAQVREIPRFPEAGPVLYDQLADAIEEVVREMHSRELHHFEEEAESARLRSTLERIDTVLRGDGRSSVLIVAAQEIINESLEGH